MKKTLILSLACVFGSVCCFADLTGNGYYRVENYKTLRYVSVVDNRGSINFVSTTADLGAIDLTKNFETVSSDAASVLYIYKVGSEYNISCQGTSVYGIISHYVSLDVNGTSDGQNLYRAYGTHDGYVRYLGDKQNVLAYENGTMSINAHGDLTKWYIKPVEADGDNYFGVVPTTEASVGDYQGKFMSLYASFPFSAYSDGIKFYAVDKVGAWGQVTLKEVTGVMPAKTPVIVMCGGDTSSENRLNVGGEGAAVSVDASVKGVFFNCGKGGHINRVAYDKETMRVLGVCEDGELGFVQADLDFIPANTFYISVPAESPAEFRIVPESEFSGVEEVGAESGAKTVYTITGIKVADNMSADEVRSLPAGMYIVGGKKTIVR